MTVMTERLWALLEAISLTSGITRAQLRKKLYYYDDLTDSSFNRAFDRDLEALRQSGYPIVVGEDGHYRYDRSAPLIAPVNSIDVGLLRTAVAGIGRTGLHATVAHNGLQKLLASADADTSPTQFFRASIPEGDGSTLIARALQYGREVTFDYVGTSSSTPHRYRLAPAELLVHFNSFYVRGLSQREDGPWQRRSFKVARMVEGSLTVERAQQAPTNEAPAASDPTRDPFVVSDIQIAIRPGAALPFAARGTLRGEIHDVFGEQWPIYQFDTANRQRLFDALLTYGLDVRVVGGNDLRSEWAERLGYLAMLAQGGGTEETC